MFLNGLADLDELILLCRDDKAKNHIAEAISCYKVGAYRQCIVATWIAVVYDIIHKLQELDLTGDKKARTKLDEYEIIWQEGNIQKALDYERQILDMARGDFELLSSIEYSDLVRIRDDRNRCAHPSMSTPEEIYHPSAELARTHLRNAVTHLLQQPPVQGKAALERVTKEVESDYFPTDVEEAKAVFKTGPMSRPRDSLVRNFTLVLIKTLLFEELDEKKERRYIAALVAIREMYHDIIERTLDTRLNDLMIRVDDDQIQNCLKFLKELIDTWQYLEDDMHSRLKNYVREMPDDQLAPGLILAMDVPGIYQVACERLNRVYSYQLSELIRKDRKESRTEFITLAVQEYIDAGSFNQANSIAINLIIPNARYLNLEQIDGIIKASQENSEILGCFERRNVFNAIRNSRIISEDNFNELLVRYGFDEEVFNENEWEEDE